MKFLFKYPTRSRPDIFIKIINLYYGMMSGKHEFEFIVSLNSDDTSMLNPHMIKFMSERPNLKFFHDNHAGKVAAINADVDKAKNDWDILCLVSDDMIPQVSGYDNIIAENMIKHFPGIDGALHFPDGYHPGFGLITFSIIGRKLYDNLGYIYHPDYISLWCDNEFTDVVKNNGKCQNIDQLIIKHEWVGSTRSDALLKKNESYFGRDKAVFLERRNRGYPKEKIF